MGSASSDHLRELPPQQTKEEQWGTFKPVPPVRSPGLLPLRRHKQLLVRSRELSEVQSPEDLGVVEPGAAVAAVHGRRDVEERDGARAGEVAEDLGVVVQPRGVGGREPRRPAEHVGVGGIPRCALLGDRGAPS